MSPKPMRGLVVWRVFWRSLWIQSSWHPEGMQNLGLSYALYPALKTLFPDEKKRKEALLRHLAFFNTQPYVAAALLGGIIHLETQVALGDLPPQRVVAFKQALMGPLAALGDGFFWLSLRPFAAACAAFSVPFIGPWAAVLFIVLYNVPHVWLRIRLFQLGLKFGEGLVEQISKWKLPRRGTQLRMGVAGFLGGSLLWWVWLSATMEKQAWWHGLFYGTLGLAGWVAGRFKWAKGLVFLVVTALTVALGAWIF